MWKKIVFFHVWRLGLVYSTLYSGQWTMEHGQWTLYHVHLDTVQCRVYSSQWRACTIKGREYTGETIYSVKFSVNNLHLRVICPQVPCPLPSLLLDTLDLLARFDCVLYCQGGQQGLPQYLPLAKITKYLLNTVPKKSNKYLSFPPRKFKYRPIWKKYGVTRQN